MLRSIWVRRASFGLILLAACEAAAAADQTTPSDKTAAEPQTQIWRFVSSRKVNVLRQERVAIFVQPPDGGHEVRMLLPESGADAKQFADTVKNVQAGTLLEIASNKDKNLDTVTSLQPWQARPGEDTPHGCIYLGNHTAKDSADVIVLLGKYKKQFEVRVPEVKNGTEVLPDSMIMDELAAVHEGDVVWAQLESGTPQVLDVIAPMKEPQEGKLVRISSSPVDGHPATTAQIDMNGNLMDCVVFGRMHDQKWVSDPKVVAALHKLHNGTDVYFRVRQAADRAWLLEIEPVSQRTAQNAPNQDRGNLGLPVRPGGGLQIGPGGF